MAAGHRQRDALLGFRIVVGDRSGLHIVLDDWHVQHHAGARADRQERRVARGALLAKRRQHDGHHLLQPLQHAQQRGVEFSRRVVVGRTGEFVVEAEGVEERPQPRIVVRAETVMGAERIRHARQRPAEMLLQELLVRHVVRHLAQAVHVVGKRQQPRLDLVLGQHAKGVADHGGAGDLAEGADMRQARRAVAGFEQHLVLRAFLQPRDNGLGLLERPGVGLFGERAQIARAEGKVDGGHQERLSVEAAETSASEAKCKMTMGTSSFRDGPKDQTSGVQLHPGESRDSQVRNCAP